MLSGYTSKCQTKITYLTRVTFKPLEQTTERRDMDSWIPIKVSNTY